MKSYDTVAVTGIGALTSFGPWEETWQALLRGESAVEEIQRFDANPYTSKVAAEVRIDTGKLLDRRLARKTSPFQQYALLAAREAVRHAGLVDSKGDLKRGPKGVKRERVGVSIGVGLPSIEVIDEILEHSNRAEKASPGLILKGLQGNAAFFIAQELGIAGGVVTTNTDACNAGTSAIGIGKTAIEDWDWVDVVLAGGAEGLVIPFLFTAFEQMKILAQDEKACRPYDIERGGFPLGEGAVILVLERLSCAIDRGARILAVLAGFGLATSAYNTATPHPKGEGIQMAAKRAIEMAGISPDEIGLVVTHGVSTIGDVGEAAAIAALFGKEQPWVCSITPNLGHPMAPAGALKAAVAVSALAKGVIPPTLNFSQLHPDCLAVNPNLRVCTKKTIFNAEAAMSWSAGLGDVQGCLVWRRWQDKEGSEVHS